MINLIPLSNRLNKKELLGRREIFSVQNICEVLNEMTEVIGFVWEIDRVKETL